MAKFFDKFKHNKNNNHIHQLENKISQLQNKNNNMKNEKFQKKQENVSFNYGDDFNEPFDGSNKKNKNKKDYDFFDGFEDDVGIQPSQKPESFHHFILENQYKDLEKSIRGYKDVYNRETGQWDIKRKKEHCFTDEEAEDILRTAQSHLATDIKLSWIPKDSFGLYMDALYKTISFIFREIAEYRYGYRFGRKLTYDEQSRLKLQNLKIFLELWTRIQANYSRAVGGQENKFTHDSVKAQESLQQTDKDLSNKRYI